MMKRIGTFAAIAFGWAAVLAAQGAGQQPGQQPGRSGGPDDSRTSQTSQANTITLTGCLERGGASSGSAPSAPGAPGASAQSSSGVASFILTDATTGSGSGAASPGAAGTSGAGTPGAAGTSGAAAAAGRTYALDGTASELSSHVDKRVQVTGTMASSSGASSPGSGPGATPSGAAGASSSASANAPRIKVVSIREVPGECK